MLHVPHLPCPKRMVDLAAWSITTLKRSTDWHLRISVGQFWNEWDKSLSLTVNISDAKHSMSRPTLWTSLSSTLLQTLPELITPLKGHLYLHVCMQLSTNAVSALQKVWVLRSNIAPKHPCKHETYPPWGKKVCLDSNDFGFICKQRGQI